jgi:hypothetical protein
MDPRKRCSLKQVSVVLKNLLDQVGVSVSHSLLKEKLNELLEKIVGIEDLSDRNSESLKFLNADVYQKMIDLRHEEEDSSL